MMKVLGAGTAVTRQFPNEQLLSFVVVGSITGFYRIIHFFGGTV
jgi:hypothetical protein